MVFFLKIDGSEFAKVFSTYFFQNFMRKSQRSLQAFFLAFFTVLFSVSAQQVHRYEELDAKFKSYDVYSINSSALLQKVKSSDRNQILELQLADDMLWKLEVRPSGIISDSYIATIAGQEGITETRGFNAMPVTGRLANMADSKVSLTFNENFIYGFVKTGMVYYNIEPLYHFVSNAPYDMYVVYSSNDIREVPDMKCGFEEMIEKGAAESQRIKNTGERLPGGCYLILYSTASDFSMFQQYGGTVGVQNHNLGVLNNVQTNYDNEFADEIQFQMVQQWVSTCSTCDPWTASTNPNTLLNSFRNWALSNLTQNHNLASLWTRRDLDGSVIGLAWLNSLCTNNRYNLLEDFTSNASFKRVLMAHEVGHNFGANHDATGSNTIMAPSVNTSTTWSAASITAIQSGYLSASCLGTCVPVNPPTANFTFTVLSSCQPGQVQYTDTSTGATSRSWSFPGGTPATSTAANPLVTYNNPGTYNASLTVTGPGGSNTKTVNSVITVIAPPVALFTYVTNLSNRTVLFNFSGSGATSYNWNFGDGGTSGVPFPSHTYQNDGTYIVTLTVSNACGTSTYSVEVVVLTYPTANFSSDVTAVCQGNSVSFINTSSNNSQYFLWSFQGGIPATSQASNPVVQYNTPGTYTVSLTVYNAAGNNTKTVVGYITVNPLPVPSFTYSVDGGTVTFTNNSQFSNEFSWNFGDGTGSSMTNPVHNYTQSGTYQVELVASNGCGIISTVQSVVIAIGPTAAFVLTGNNPACVGQSIQFQSTNGSGTVTHQWYFEGGMPSSSNLPDPEVLYLQAGVYDVQHIVSGPDGSDTLTLENFIIVNTVPQVNFSYDANALQVTFTAQVQNGGIPQWNFGDGQTATGTTVTHSFAAEGTYEITLSSSNDCGVTSDIEEIEVFAIPTANITASQQQACVGDVIQFNSENNPSVMTWSWTFEGGTPATSNVQNPSVTYAQKGVYSVSLTVSNPAGQTTVVQNQFITINHIPETGFGYEVNQNVISLQNTGANTLATTWVLAGNGQTYTVTGQNAQFTFPENGIYILTQNNHNECGTNSLTAHDAILIDVYPVPAFTFNTADICAGQPVIFSSASDNTENVSWQLQGADPESSDQNQVEVTYGQPGVYQVTLQASNALGTRSVQQWIEVITVPEADFDFTIVEGVTQFTYTGSQANVVWNFGDNLSTPQNPNQSNQTNPMHTYTRNGVYTVTLYASNACGTDTITREVQVILSSVSDMQVADQILLYPNPNDGRFIVELSSTFTGEARYEVFTLSGTSVHSGRVHLQAGKSTGNFDLNPLYPGNYLLRITTDKKVHHTKFAVK